MPDCPPQDQGVTTPPAGKPKWRPVRPWQHWRFALTVTFCWLTRRHFLDLDRISGSGITFYRCRVCRSNLADTRELRARRSGGAT